MVLQSGNICTLDVHMICENCQVGNIKATKLWGGRTVFVEGPQGSGKSSLVKALSEVLGYKISRGFPSGDYLRRSPSRQMVCQEANRLVVESSPETIFDRSPISQHVYLARNGSNPQECLECSALVFKRFRDLNPTVIFLDSNKEACLARQDPKGLCAIEPEQISSEIAMYRYFAQGLESVLGKRRIILNNDLSISLKNLLTLAQKQLERISIK